MKTLNLVLVALSCALVGCPKIHAANVAAKTAAQEIDEWKLSPSDIGQTLEKGPRVDRSRPATAGEKVATAADNARIISEVSSKMAADSDLADYKITVEANAGTVTLKGIAHSPGSIGNAIRLTLETEGVTHVISLLAVEKP
jgi:osmotically-inducible protein OsmY